MPPFVVFALPRSRTTWLAKYLSYQDWHCGHEESRHWRNLDDVKSWLSQPNTGTVETGIAPFWRLLHRYAPDTKVVTVRRPVKEVVDSLLHLDGVGSLDHAELTKQMRRLDAKLDQIEDRLPDVLSVRSSRLSVFAPAARVFRHCLPYEPDFDHWQRLNRTNVQCDMPALFRYAVAYAPQIRKIVAIARHATLADMRKRPAVEIDGLRFVSTTLDEWLADPAVKDHIVRIGEEPDWLYSKNIPLWKIIEQMGNLQIVSAKSNGRTFGYLMTMFSPSLEDPDIMTGINLPFYASPDFPGLGRRLQRVAMQMAKQRGADEMWLRIGPRDSAPALEKIYESVGAVRDGALYRLDLRN